MWYGGYSIRILDATRSGICDMNWRGSSWRVIMGTKIGKPIGDIVG